MPEIPRLHPHPTHSHERREGALARTPAPGTRRLRLREASANVAAQSIPMQYFIAPIAALSVAMAAASTAAAAPAAALEPVAVAVDVYVFPGEDGEAAPDNGGRIGNAGFIVGSSGVVVIDTGVSYLHGREMLAGIARVTPLPVRLVIILHCGTCRPHASCPVTVG